VVFQAIRQLPTPVTVDMLEQTLRQVPELNHDTDGAYITQLAQKIDHVFQTVGFHDLPQNHQQFILSGIQRSFVQEWKLQAFEHIAKKGWRWTGMSL